MEGVERLCICRGHVWSSCYSVIGTSPVFPHYATDWHENAHRHHWFGLWKGNWDTCELENLKAEISLFVFLVSANHLCRCRSDICWWISESVIQKRLHLLLFPFIKSYHLSFKQKIKLTSQLPAGLLVQLVECCTSIAEVMGSNSSQAWIFFRP